MCNSTLYFFSFFLPKRLLKKEILNCFPLLKKETINDFFEKKKDSAAKKLYYAIKYRYRGNYYYLYIYINYDWLSNQLRYFSRETHSTQIGMNAWYTPHSSEHCP